MIQFKGKVYLEFGKDRWRETERYVPASRIIQIVAPKRDGELYEVQIDAGEQVDCVRVDEETATRICEYMALVTAQEDIFDALNGIATHMKILLSL